jgi:hypothetical protein
VKKPLLEPLVLSVRLFTLDQYGHKWEARSENHRRLGIVRRCGKCKRGIIGQFNSLLRGHCLVCQCETVRDVLPMVEGAA